MKIVVVGAGSFVFAPSVLYDAIAVHRLSELHVALVDPNRQMADLMAGLGRRMARDEKVTATVTSHADWREALDGTDFVICCAAAQLQRRFDTDVEIIRRRAPGHLVTEFGGVQGISYTLRQIALIESLATDMRRICPKAWLLCSSNPLPRVCQAAHELGIRAAGFCSNSMIGYGLVGKLMLDRDEDFPWTETIRCYDAVMAGMNHITFMLSLRNRADGRDTMPEFLGRAKKLKAFTPVTAQLVEQTGCWTSNGDEHIRDFLVPSEYSRPMKMSSHGTPEERDAQIRLLRAAGEGNADWTPLLKHRAWEKPVDFAVALSGGRPAQFHSLNLVNEGQLPDLPNGVFVETPATVDRNGPAAAVFRLPDSVARLSRPMAELNQILVRAALTRQNGLLEEAIELDPTILDKAAGLAALEECLKAHSDLLTHRP